MSIQSSMSASCSIRVSREVSGRQRHLAGEKATVGARHSGVDDRFPRSMGVDGFGLFVWKTSKRAIMSGVRSRTCADRPW